MARRGSTSRRSASEWGIRGALALLAVVLGYFGVTQSLASAIEDRNPARAYQLAPYNGHIAGLLARARFADHQAAGPGSEAAMLARTALRRDPTTVPALTTLGFQAQLRGDAPRAKRLFAYAQALSRRDLQTELWAIEDAVSRGNVSGALRHYDIALRTSKVAPELLFPVLASAVSEPAVRTGLITTLAAKPAWAGLFLRFAADNAADPADVASLYTGLRRTGTVPPEAASIVVNRLVGAGTLEAAWQYYASFRTGANRRSARNPRFRDNPASPSLFDWVPVDDDSIATSVQRNEQGGGQGGVFDFAVPPGVGGILLRQAQLLPQGTYRLEGHSSGIEQPGSSLPYWVLACQDGRELGRVVVPPSAQGSGRFAGQFSVPPGCPLQTLSLVARSSDELSGVTGQFDLVRLFPVGADR